MADFYADIPELNAERAGILKRRKIAEMIQQQAMRPLESQQAGAYVVPTSPLLAIGKVLEAYIGKKADDEATLAEAGLGQKAQGMLSAEKQKVADAVLAQQEMQRPSPTMEGPMPGETATLDTQNQRLTGLNLQFPQAEKERETRLKTNEAIRAREDMQEQQRLMREANAAAKAQADADRAQLARDRLDWQKQMFGMKQDAANKTGRQLTKGQEAVDRNFGKEYAEYQAGGGSADVEKQLIQLDKVANELSTPGNDYTGPAVGLMPDAARAFTNPKAVAAKNMVEEVAQRNLRTVLGAQFTQVEGERLIARAYNPSLEPTENARRVRALANQIRTAANTKEDAARYFEQNGTLTGWKGRMPTYSDFENAIEPEKSGKKSEQQMSEAQKWALDPANENDPRLPAVKKKLGM